MATLSPKKTAQLFAEAQRMKKGNGSCSARHAKTMIAAAESDPSMMRMLQKAGIVRRPARMGL